jgi:HlyD family secretion protein
MKKIKPLWLVVAAVVILGGLGWSLFGTGSDTTSYRFERVDRGDIIVAISATGTLNAVKTVQVGSQVSGTIARLYVDYNSEITQGQLLAQLDPTFLQATVNEQRANVERATAQVNEAERTFRRTSDLFAKALVSQADMDAAVAARESAQATLRQNQASLDRAEVNLRYATIRAPISGVVISRSVDVGQTVAASLQAPTLFTIANDLRKMQVEASVDEADIGQVATGQHVTFRVDAFAEEEFEGVVSQIRLAPVVSQNVVTYTVIIEVNNPRQRLMPGMTATVSIEVARRENVLRIPITALRFTPPDAPATDSSRRQGGQRPAGMQRPGGQRTQQGEGGRPAGLSREQRTASRGRVWILERGTPVPVPVRRGVQNARYAEVDTDRLKEGDNVIVGLANPTTAQAGGSQTQNPLLPRMPGGGPGGGGRRGF